MSDRISVRDIDKLYIDAPEISKESQIFVNIREGNDIVMNGFHMHSHYEISFIESGNITVCLSDCVYKGSQPRVVLIPPFVQHFMVPDQNTNYKRINVSFTEEFVSRLPDEWAVLRRVFKKSGVIVELDEKDCENFRYILALLSDDVDDRRRLYLLLYYVSALGDIAEKSDSDTDAVPRYLVEAMKYINENYKEKVTAQKIADRLKVGRTTLMMGFRQYFGLSLHDYLLKIRIKQADILRKSGASVETAAFESGFCDAGSYIRAYRRLYGVTPTGRR